MLMIGFDVLVVFVLIAFIIVRVILEDRRLRRRLLRDAVQGSSRRECLSGLVLGVTRGEAF
jgi:hypothetical protein